MDKEIEAMIASVSEADQGFMSHDVSRALADKVQGMDAIERFAFIEYLQHLASERVTIHSMDDLPSHLREWLLDA